MSFLSLILFVVWIRDYWLFWPCSFKNNYSYSSGNDSGDFVMIFSIVVTPLTLESRYETPESFWFTTHPAVTHLKVMNDQEIVTIKLLPSRSDHQALTIRLWPSGFDRQALTIRLWASDHQALTIKLWPSSKVRCILNSRTPSHSAEIHCQAHFSDPELIPLVHPSDPELILQAHYSQLPSLHYQRCLPF